MSRSLSAKYVINSNGDRLLTRIESKVSHCIQKRFAYNNVELVTSAKTGQHFTLGAESATRKANFLFCSALRALKKAQAQIIE